MRSKFRLVLDVVLDTEMATTNVIQAARRHYEAEGPVKTVDENGTARTLAPDEFIDEIEDALMELAQRNPLPDQCEWGDRTCVLQVPGARIRTWAVRPGRV